MGIIPWDTHRAETWWNLGVIFWVQNHVHEIFLLKCEYVGYGTARRRTYCSPMDLLGYKKDPTAYSWNIIGIHWEYTRSPNLNHPFLNGASWLLKTKGSSPGKYSKLRPPRAILTRQANMFWSASKSGSGRGKCQNMLVFIEWSKNS